MNKKSKFVIMVLLGGVVLVALRLSPIADLFSLQAAQNYKHTLAELVEQNVYLCAAAYSFIFMVVAASCFPGGTAVLTLLGGYLFGIFPGLFVVNFGATLGAAGAFCLVRSLLGDSLQRVYADRLTLFNAHLKDRGVSYLLSIRLLAVFPFFLVNILAGLTTISIVTFMWTTSVGMIPAHLVFLYVGKQLGSVSSIGQVFTLPVLCALAGLALLCLTPTLVSNKSKN